MSDFTKKRTDSRSSAPRVSLIVYHGRGAEVVPLPLGAGLVVGRRAPADIVIDDAELSRRHARFEWTGTEIIVQDLGSTNGTLTGGREVDRATLSAGDEVIMGSVTIAVHAPQAEPAAPATGALVVSSMMRKLHDDARRAGATDAPVLIIGETGVGKDVLAHVVHGASHRSKSVMKTINCGVVPEALAASELFGHERGAFTGADRQAIGLFEAASGGTVFLDEVGELAQSAQVALLRVLETGTLTRVGSHNEIRVDVRLIAATNRDIQTAADEGAFRRDLLFRMNTITLEVPPLRARADEIAGLAGHFLERCRVRYGHQVQELSPEALGLLRAHDWPGNLRELKNVVERAAIMARSAILGAGDLPPLGRSKAPRRGATIPPPTDGKPLKDRVRDYEAAEILAALEQSGWNQTAAAKALNLPVRTLAYKIRTFGLKAHFPRE